MSERKLVATLRYGPTGSAMAALSLDLLAGYARRVGADFFVLDQTNAPPPSLDDMPGINRAFAVAMLDKMAFLREKLRDCERLLWLDLDAMVRPHAPDLFALTPTDRPAFADECAVGNDWQVWFRHQHMAQTCLEESLPIPDSKGRYFNCGVMMLPSNSRWLFEPRHNPVSHPWCEQSLINVRLFLHRQPVFVLPECFNRFVYWPGLVPRRQEEMSWVLHFAGPPDYATRLTDMARLRERWRQEYPNFPWKEKDRD